MPRASKPTPPTPPAKPAGHVQDPVPVQTFRDASAYHAARQAMRDAGRDTRGTVSMDGTYTLGATNYKRRPEAKGNNLQPME
jgi:hypothetical protein